MARVRQFAKDMGMSYNQANNLVKKGRALKDGGSSVLESTMNQAKPIKAKEGKFTKSKVKIEKLLTEADKPKPRPKDPLRACLLYTSPSPRDGLLSRMPSSA